MDDRERRVSRRERELDEAERALLADLSKQLYNDEHAPEFEDIVSGRGLEFCHRHLVANGAPGAKDDDAAAVASNALNGDATAQQALLWHYEYLMRNCQQLAIATQCGGVVLCGDNQVSLNSSYSMHTIQFLLRSRLAMQRFCTITPTRCEQHFSTRQKRNGWKMPLFWDNRKS